MKKNFLIVIISISLSLVMSGCEPSTKFIEDEDGFIYVDKNSFITRIQESSQNFEYAYIREYDQYEIMYDLIKEYNKDLDDETIKSKAQELIENNNTIKATKEYLSTRTPYMFMIISTEAEKQSNEKKARSYSEIEYKFVKIFPNTIKYYVITFTNIKWDNVDNIDKSDVQSKTYLQIIK